MLGRLVVVNVALFAAYAGVLSVLLPQQIARIDPEGKVGALALVTSVSFGVTALAQPLVGALSDRTRSRWGRRVPWMLGGAVVGGVALGAMGGASSVAMLVVLWAIAQFCLNGTDIASSVYLVDGFPVQQRGLAAGVLGAAAVAGGVVGTMLAGSGALTSSVGYWVLAAVVLVAVLVFALTSRDRVVPQAQAQPFRVGVFLRGFVVNPRRHPDFVIVLFWRICFTVAYGSVHGYLLYILSDFVGVGEEEAAVLVGVAAVIGGAGLLVAVLLGGWLSDRLGRRRPFLVAAGLAVVAALAVPLLSPTVPGILALAGVLGASLGLSIACGTALASQVMPDPDREAARGLGVFNVATNLGQAAAPLVAAVVIASTGGYAALFVVSAVIMLIGTGLIAFVREGGASAPIARDSAHSRPRVTRGYTSPYRRSPASPRPGTM